MIQIKPVMFTLSAGLAAAILGGCGAKADSSAAQSSAATPPPAVQPAEARIQTAAAQDPLARGAKLYKRCKSCHTLEENGKHRVGPNMWDLYGSTAGTKEGFAYSKAMKASGLVWNDETLNGYIENPRRFMPGNRMSYAGLRKPEDRAAVLAYIKSQTTP